MFQGINQSLLRFRTRPAVLQTGRACAFLLVALVLAGFLTAPAHGQAVSVLTQNYDNGRSGSNNNETTLTPALLTASPTTFVADEDFSGGATINHANTINTSKVTNPAPAAVYQTSRIATATVRSFTYTIPGLTAGSSHTVRLHFCETFFTTTGSRVFNVSINGTQVLTNFDIVAASGGQNIANVQQFTATADASGNITITFTSVTNNALISGIEID